MVYHDFCMTGQIKSNQNYDENKQVLNDGKLYYCMVSYVYEDLSWVFGQIFIAMFC